FQPLAAMAAVPRVVSVTPPSGSLTGVFTEFTIAFDQPVSGVDARDLLWTYTLHDTSPPTLLAIHPPAGITLRKFAQVEVTFSEPVTGLKASDLQANGQPATNVTGVSAGPYVFQFPNIISGAISVTWAGNQSLSDLADVPNHF